MLCSEICSCRASRCGKSTSVNLHRTSHIDRQNVWDFFETFSQLARICCHHPSTSMGLAQNNFEKFSDWYLGRLERRWNKLQSSPTPRRPQISSQAIYMFAFYEHRLDSFTYIISQVFIPKASSISLRSFTCCRVFCLLHNVENKEEIKMLGEVSIFVSESISLFFCTRLNLKRSEREWNLVEINWIHLKGSPIWKVMRKTETKLLTKLFLKR